MQGSAHSCASCPTQILPKLTPGAPAIVVTHGMALKCFLRGILHSLPTQSRNIATLNTSITEVGFLPASPAALAAAAAAAAAPSDGTLSIDSSRGPAEGTGSSSWGVQGTWHVLRVNDAGHLTPELR